MTKSVLGKKLRKPLYFTMFPKPNNIINPALSEIT